MKSQKSSRKLYRYTTLPILLDLLKRKKIVLLDPTKWEDRNDADIISEYIKRKNISKLFAVCFSVNTETVHHWKSYADGISGCYIQFDEDKLLASFKSIKQIRWGDVDYKRIKEAQSKSIQIDNIPFTKRWPYRIEKEFRIIWEGQTKKEKIEIDIDLKSINKIMLSQKMPVDVAESIKHLLRNAFEDPSKLISRSTLYENRSWINAFSK